MHEHKTISGILPVGIQNLGSTCYMNSVFQQLYAIQDFRSQILNFNIACNESTENNVMVLIVCESCSGAWS